MPHLFSYGTLQQPDVQLATFARRLEGVPDALEEWVERYVEISDPEVLHRSGKRFHPILVRGGGSVIHGSVFELSSEEMAAADAYEVSDYVRAEVTLVSGRRAFMYVSAKA